MIENKKKLVSKAVHAGGWRIVRKFAKSIPGLSTAMALGLAGYDIKKKGVVNGLLNTGLDAIPIVGTVKNVAELVTGDFLPDKKTAIDKKISDNNQNSEKG